MAYASKAFSEQSIRALSDDITAFLAANPSSIPISVSNTVEGAGFYAILVYQV